MDIQEKIKNQLKEMREQLGAETKREEIILSPSDKREHGDYASNIAFRKAKLLHRAPLRLAEKIAAEFKRDGVDHVGYKIILGEGRILGGGLSRVFHALSPLERGMSSFFLLRS